MGQSTIIGNQTLAAVNFRYSVVRREHVFMCVQINFSVFVYFQNNLLRHVECSMFSSAGIRQRFALTMRSAVSVMLRNKQRGMSNPNLNGLVCAILFCLSTYAVLYCFQFIGDTLYSNAEYFHLTIRRCAVQISAE